MFKHNAYIISNHIIPYHVSMCASTTLINLSIQSTLIWSDLLRLVDPNAYNPICQSKHLAIHWHNSRLVYIAPFRKQVFTCFYMFLLSNMCVRVCVSKLLSMSTKTKSKKDVVSISIITIIISWSTIKSTQVLSLTLMIKVNQTLSSTVYPPVVAGKFLDFWHGHR